MLPELILRFSTQTGDKLRSSRGTGMGATASYKWFMRAGPGDHCLSSFFVEITVCKVLWKICYPSISYRSLATPQHCPFLNPNSILPITPTAPTKQGDTMMQPMALTNWTTAVFQLHYTAKQHVNEGFTLCCPNCSVRKAQDMLSVHPS